MLNILDTNVLLRFLIGDVPEHHTQAERWLKEGERGQSQIYVTSLVIAEACFVLESVYKLKRPKIATALELFISQEWLIVPERKVLLNLWKSYLGGLHFVDSYLLVLAQLSGGEVLSFDRELKNRERE